MDHISSSGFAQIDHCLINKDALCLVEDISSDRTLCLQSHHFILIATFAIKFQRHNKIERHTRIDASQLADKHVSSNFCQTFCSKIPLDISAQSLNDKANGIHVAMHAAATLSLHAGPPQKRPWISSSTLALIEKTEKARSMHNYVDETVLHKQIRAAAT